MRLAVARAWLDFVQGGIFRTDPPPHVREEADRRGYVNLLRGLARHRRLLEAEVARLGRRPVLKIDAAPLALAALGLFQLRFQAVAPHAAVNEAVSLASTLGCGHAKGWLNAVLRAAQREEETWPQRLAAMPTALRTSHPDWLVERWQARYGEQQATAICEANDRYDGAALRVETRRISRREVLQRLHDESVECRAHPWLDGALWAPRLGEVLHSRAFRDGLLYVQDASSQLLCGWLNPMLRGKVLDACAAPGGKLTWLAGQAKPERELTAAEPEARRLALVRENLHRLRQPAVPLLQADAARLPFADGCAERGWDAVLLDVPCSATGMIRKYPELKWRKHPEDLPKMAAVQALLLAEAARVVRPGGRVAYVTCSLEPEENEQQVQAFLAAHPHFKRCSLRGLAVPKALHGDPERMLSAEGDLLLLPGAYSMGLYAALLERTDGRR